MARIVAAKLEFTYDESEEKGIEDYMKQLTLPMLKGRGFTAHTVKTLTKPFEFSLFGRKLYLFPILDMYNWEIISYAIIKRFVKYFFELLTQALVSAAGNGAGRKDAKRACGRLETVFVGR